MKSLIVLVVGLLAVGCSSTPTMKSVAGVYEGKWEGLNAKMVLLGNGDGEIYYDKKKYHTDFKWKVGTVFGGSLTAMVLDGESRTFVLVHALFTEREAPPSFPRFKSLSPWP